MDDFDKAGKPGIPMCRLINPNDLPEADRDRVGLEMMRRRTRKGDPEAALHIQKHVVQDIPADE